MQSDIKIYTTSYCPYCKKAVALLERKKLKFTEIDVENDQEMRAKLVEMTGGRKTVPQIFIRGKSIGGCDDLHALENSGELDRMLGQ